LEGNQRRVGMGRKNTKVSSQERGEKKKIFKTPEVGRYDEKG